MNLILIPLLPLVAFTVLILVGRRLGKFSAVVALAALFGSFVSSVVTFLMVAARAGSIALVPEHTSLHLAWNWLPFGESTFQLGFLADPLSTIMCLVVTGIGWLIMLYSVGYMWTDSRFSRFFAYLSLFITGMLTLVLADHFLLLYIGWELVGLCSYLLISFWFEKPEAAAAGKKAFLTTRVGDLGLLAGILLIGKITGSLSFLELESQAAALGPWVSVVVLLLFWGAAGKSAQFPLHIWLPDAMEGPTPVSALIHAATMVAAGVYLVARTMPLFVQSPEALLTVAIVGGLTSLFAATIACTQTDLKKILAYSTISQLGFMMLGLGCGLAWVGMFHLVTHAVFKALLFLGAGSVIFAMHHEQDVRKMGGLIRRMPVTGITFILGAVAMAGVPPFSGFWSKEGILIAIHSALPVPFLVLALMISFLTAFYISRAVILTFFGRPTEVPDAEESPWVMTIPLMLLGAGAMGVGLLGSPWMHEAFQHFLGAKVHHDAHAAWLAPVSIAVAFSGIGLAWIQYQRGLFLLPEKTRASFRPLVELAAHKYYIDEMVEAALLRPVRNLAQKAFSFDASVVDGAVNGAGRLGLWLSRWKGRFDAVVVDGAVNGTANTVGWAGGLLRKLQTGLVQNYLLLATAGAVAIFLMARGLS